MSQQASMAAEIRIWANEEQKSFKRIFMLSFPLFVLVASLARLVPGRRAKRLAGGQRQTILSEARALADMVIPFAFMA